MYLFNCAGDNSAPCSLYEVTPNYTAGTANMVLVKSNIVPRRRRSAVGAVEGAIFQTRADGTEYLYATVGEDGVVPRSDLEMGSEQQLGAGDGLSYQHHRPLRYRLI